MEHAVKLMDFLQTDVVALDIPATDKYAVIDAAAQRLAHLTRIERSIIRDALDAREKLGPTVVHRGVAIPHARLDGLAAPAAVFLRLAAPVDFAALDEHPVDLVFAVLWPKEAHEYSLIGLAKLCRLLREPCLLRGLRAAGDAHEARLLLNLAAGLAASRRMRSRLPRRSLQRVPA